MKLKPKPRSEPEERFLICWRALRGPTPVREHAFAAALGRKWRFDFAWPAALVAVEIEGGIYNGRHTRAAGFVADAEKYNTAMALGWRVFRLAPSMIEAAAIEQIKACIAGAPGELVSGLLQRNLPTEGRVAAREHAGRADRGGGS